MPSDCVIISPLCVLDWNDRYITFYSITAWRMDLAMKEARTVRKPLACR